MMTTLDLRNEATDLAEIERRLDRILRTQEILIAVRLIEDGQAVDWREALAIARDLDRLAAIYPVLARAALAEQDQAADTNRSVRDPASREEG